MSEESVRVDLTVVARRTLEERQPGQDLDEVLLHVCKELYGDEGVAAFEACSRLLRTKHKQTGLLPEEALQQLARGDTATLFGTLARGEAGTRTRRFSSIDDLPPEVREQARHMRPGEVVVVEKSLTRPVSPEDLRQAAGPAGKFQCAACSFSHDQPFDLCPLCGQERRRSFWSRLFGR